MSEYWTSMEREALTKVTNFEELVVVAFTVLDRMPKPIAMVCGPMSTGGAGTLEKNMARFERAVRAIEKTGVTVFDQIPFQQAMIRLADPTKEYEDKILEMFYRKIFENGYIEEAFFLPDWQSSRGASWEHELLSLLGVKIVDYPPDLLEEILYAN